MMNDQELGELVVKIQADDVRPHDLSDFLEAVMNDAELRTNLKLAGKVADLDAEIREKNCAAQILFLLSYSTLSPTEKPDSEPKKETTRLFSEKFQVGTISGWKDHFSRGPGVPPPVRQNSKSPNRPDLYISEHLYSLITSLEEFWDVRGKFTK